MAIAEGSSTAFSYKKESVANTQETGSGGTVLRRVTGQLDLVKPEVTSAEKRGEFQDANVNHGTRSVDWAINGEMFGGDYSEFEAAILRRDYAGVTTVSASAGDGFTISSGVLTRAAGGSESFIDDGLYEGLVVRFTNLTTAGNNNRNVRITALTATTLTLVAVDGGAAIADSTSSETATLVIPGQFTYIPATSHTSDTFTLESWDSKTSVSHIAYGNKVGTMDLSVQPDQPISQNFSGLGIDRSSSGSRVLTSPSAAGTGAAMSAGIGFIRVGGSSIAVVTGLDMTIDVGLQNAPVILPGGSNPISPDVFYGRVAEVTGTITVLKQGYTLSDYFDNETEVTLDFFIEAPGSAPKSFKNIYLKRVKLNSASEDDPDGPVVQTFGFRALYPATATGVLRSTILLQDSSIS